MKKQQSAGKISSNAVYEELLRLRAAREAEKEKKEKEKMIKLLEELTKGREIVFENLSIR